jgi:hypothetical protein
MNDASLHELRAQARITYRYWHIYLMLRLREIETHLTQAERDELGQVVAPKPMNLLTATLIEYDLLMGDETLPDIPLPPPLALPEGTLGFYVLETSLYAISDKQRLALMRVDAHDVDALQEACEIFNTMLEELAPDMVLDCARWWALLQGAVALDWQNSDATAPAQRTKSPRLPKRSRGKGLMRGF